ncbi:MAG: hypothetical protein K0S93_1499 [Nitrososphaeraceae archaeon]|nr:hypothetical protein [Nitrososphaeraceae archaeon]
MYNNISVLNSIIFLYIYFFKYSYTILTYKKNKLKKNNSLLLIGIVSISLLIIFGAIQSSTAQRYDDDDKDHDWDRDKWNRHDDDDDDDHDWDRDKWNRHDDDDNDDDDDFKLTVRLVSDEERERSDYKVKVSGETKSIDGEEFEDDGKASVKFNLNDVDNKERVCITNERTDDETCKKFNTDGDEGTVKFDIG